MASNPKRKLFNDQLDKLASTFDVKYKLSFHVTNHFIDRVLERYAGNFEKASMELLEAINYSLPIVIYYMHLDTILPERGRITVGDYEIRGNVINDRYVLNTFVKS